MPVEQTFHFPSNVYSLLWHIEETEASLFNQLFLNEMEAKAYQGLRHPRRRLEWLAARLATQTLCQQLNHPYQGIIKDACGKPYLVGSNFSISLAHHFPYAFVAISTRASIGIDIQSIQQKLQSLSHKYLNNLEIQDSNQNPEKLTIYWSAKEAIYKADGGKGLSLKDISIQPFQQAQAGMFMGLAKEYPYVIHYSCMDNYVLAWCQPHSAS